MLRIFSMSSANFLPIDLLRILQSVFACIKGAFTGRHGSYSVNFFAFIVSFELRNQPVAPANPLIFSALVLISLHPADYRQTFGELIWRSASLILLIAWLI
jgi:hypothetical protein